MTTPTRTTGYKATVDGTSLIIEHTANRDTTADLTLYNASDDAAASGLTSSGISATLRLYDFPGGTQILAQALTMLAGGVRIAIADDATFTGVTFDAGETVRVLTATIQVTESDGSQVDVFDDTGVRNFPFYLHASPDQ